jgi:hypothetical protein
MINIYYINLNAARKGKEGAFLEVLSRKRRNFRIDIIKKDRKVD